ncbi:5' exonuclease Apollo-like isoform X1 [Mixophyes fleayi]|uniref:5' exonuclease Apollo-like isoform X1 n=1 Tax=Mixophyes fleayi TaxID=3061075 RepID=UPI003F4D8B2F
MNGAFIPNTPIAVDFWQIRRCSHIRLFFLSHMHSDHTVGLSSTWKHPLYCSPVTAKILKHKLQVNSKWINPLEVGECHMLPLDDCGIETVSVTLIDANHCPGSVMFLFEGYFGTILYTGDFRYSPFMLKHPPLKNKMIDVLYLDNTNCDPEQKLPSRQEATKQIKEIIDDHPYHDIVIGLYSLGKESLLVDLAKTFKSWVVVSPQRLELLTMLEMEDVFATQDGAGRIRVVEQSEINYANMVKWNYMHPTIAILPTSRKVKVWHKDVYVVPYSDHSSYDELIEFVSQLKPCSIIPVVKTQKCMSLLNQYLSSEASKNCALPISVKAFMKRQDLSSEVCTKNPKVLRKSLARGVEFESPDKGLSLSQTIVHCRGKQERTPKYADNELHWGKEHNMDNSYLGSEYGQLPIPLTESTVLVSSKDRTPFESSPSDKILQSSEIKFEMPSAIRSPKDMDLSVLSDSSLLYKENATLISPNFTFSPLKSPQTLFCFTRADGLSILPYMKRKKFDARHFHHQVERYLENCIHRRSQGAAIKKLKCPSRGSAEEMEVFPIFKMQRNRLWF